MIDIKEKDILDIIYELTHIKDEEGNDVPHFCFATDISVDLDAKEEEIAVIAAKNGYKIFKVFPGETMEGGLVILADGATLEPVEIMYQEFYGEVPEIAEMKLDDEEHLVEVEDKIEEDVSEDSSIKEQVKNILDNYHDEKTSRIYLFEIEPELNDRPELWIEKFDDGDIDFSQFAEHEQKDYDGKPDGSKYYSFMISGGLNGSGDWEDYLDDIKDIFKEFNTELNLEPVLYKLDTDICDDVWTGKVFLYEHPTENQLKESLVNLHETKNKRPKMKKVGDPNAKAMWGRTRHRVELPKKGKGSFKRHPKHKLEEIFVTPSKEEQDELLKRIEDLGFVIQSAQEYGFDEEAQDVHIQVYDSHEFEHAPGDSAEAVYAGHQEEINNRMSELAEAIRDFDGEHDNKFHITYSIGFGGTTSTGVDCTGRISAGIDMRAVYVEPEAVDIEPTDEDLDLEVHDLDELVWADADAYADSFKEKAKALGAELNIFSKISPERKDAFWYLDECIAELVYEDISIGIYSCGENRFSLDGDTVIRSPEDLEEEGILTDNQLVEADNEGRIDWDMNPWFEFNICQIGHEKESIWSGDLGYDVDFSLDEALDAQSYIPEVIQYFRENYCEPLEESKKKKNPLKTLAKKHAKSDKKGAMGWFVHPNVEQSIQHFNHVASDSAPSTITAPAGLGEEVDVEVADRYKWEFFPVNYYTRRGYDWDNQKDIYYAKVPETCMKVSREDYKENKLLKRRKNKKVLKGVEDFFKAHPNAKWCVISCTEVMGEREKFVNTYRVLAEQLRESQSDYWVISDGQNPKRSQVYAEIKDLDKFISELEKNKSEQYWELLHYVNNNPIKVWSTKEGRLVKEELNLTEKAEKHETLNPKLWDEGNKLKPEVREKILEITKDFTDGLEEDGIKFKLDDIVLVGSNCSYNYTNKSDLDIHLRMDTDSLECPDDLYPLLYSAYRSLYNNKMDIDFYGIPVEIYVETSETEQMSDEPLGEAKKASAVKSNGIYSVMKDEWIKEPVAEDIPEVDQEAFDKELDKWLKRYDDIMRGESLHGEKSVFDVVEALTEKIKFHYHGPLYRFEHVFRRTWDAYTEAVSMKQAINNFNAKAKEEFGFKLSAKMNIDPDYIEVVNTEPDEDSGKTIEYCDKCGTRLNDAGECPLCDLGDESVLDESVEDDKILEIEEFIEDIYDLRKTSIANDGEYGIGNLVFKEIRNLGYLDELKELKNELKSKKLSLESLKEHLTPEQLRKKVPEITVDDVKSWINDRDGWDMTIDPDTLKKADYEDLPAGWIVTQDFGLDNIFDPKDYDGMTSFIKSALVKYGDRYYIGTYKMKYGKYRGKIAIDVNRIILNTEEAIKDGIKNRQESIYRYDEYMFLTHNLISRRTGKKKPYPLERRELKHYGLDDCIVDEPIEDCFNIELVEGIFHTNISAHTDKK